ncbi:DEAD/DEAH box helicase [Candidatus Bathyarchaeota archaeon]|nr:DEAD/DEAH box helicase [Candidatus Bathyarchaeota archaeon]
MRLQERDPFSLLVKPVRRLVEERGFAKATGPQAMAIPPILEGKNVLLIAPTGTGKTEAAFLPVFSRLLQLVERPPGIRILYITPLRSLNRDLLDRLKWWCQSLDIRVSVRHGDTEVKERAQQSRSPPDILITTPETLQAIFPGKILRKHLGQVRWVIVDEVHEFAEDKRGSQLSLALERLRLITGRDFQVIGLSATIGSPERVAKFLAGSARPVELVKVPVAREMEFQILYPVAVKEDYELAERLYTRPEVAARLRVMRRIIQDQRAVLLFTNTRSVAEVLASRFKVWEVNFPVGIHHGSLAKPARITAEQGIKSGELKGLVCTSSLELGIDIGTIDLCIQYMSPRQVTRLVQRVGRSGHRVGRTARGIIVAMDSDDTLESMAIARRASQESLEPAHIPEKPLDALAHQIVGLLIFQRRWDFKQILDLYKQAYPYRELEEAELVSVLSYMHNRYPRLAWASFEDKVVMRPQSIKEMYQFYYENLSMIPDEKNYLVIDETKETPVGILDEAFIAEYGNPGTKFIIRGTPWKVSTVYGDKVYVRPVDDPTGAIPSWIGEEIPVPFEVAQEVGQIRSLVEDALDRGKTPENIAESLASQYPLDKEAAGRTITETVQQFQRGLPIPTDKRVTIEKWDDYIVVQASFGSLVNRTLAALLGNLLSEKTGTTVGVQEDPYRIIVQSTESVTPMTVKELILELASLDIRSRAEVALVNTGLFKRRMIHVARKFGAISKMADFSNISLSQLTKSFTGTAIYTEAIKDVISKDLDLDSLRVVLDRLLGGELEVTIVFTDGEPTPVAKVGLDKMERQTNLVSSEKMDQLTLESVRIRLLGEVKTFVCVEEWDWTGMMQVKDFAELLVCPNCGSKKIGILSDAETAVNRMIEKKHRSLTSREKWMAEQAMKTGELVEKHGAISVVVLAARHLRLSEAEELISGSEKVDDILFRRIIEMERKALTRRFW